MLSDWLPCLRISAMTLSSNIRPQFQALQSFVVPRRRVIIRESKLCFIRVKSRSLKTIGNCRHPLLQSFVCKINFLKATIKRKILMKLKTDVMESSQHQSRWWKERYHPAIPLRNLNLELQRQLPSEVEDRWPLSWPIQTHCVTSFNQNYPMR